MKLLYRYGWPLGHTFARMGVPTVIRLDVIHDAEADVYVGRSMDLRGLVVEAESLEGVIREANLLIPELVTGSSDHAANTMTDLRYRDRPCHA